MKYIKIILATALFTVSGLTFAQSPQKIHSFAIVLESPQWYKEQVKAWHNEIEKDPENRLAWYYYYYATRNLHYTDASDKRSFKERADARISLVDSMGKAIPDSYEYNLCMWKEHANDNHYQKYLDRVYELGTNRIEHIDWVINDGELERDIDKRNNALIKRWEAGLLSPGMANYNRNVLSGLSENAILLTVGDNDTYPAWYVQATGYRTDVYVINLSLLMVEEYRMAIFKELGIQQNIEIDWNAKSADNPDHVSHFYEKIIPAFISNTKGHDVYVGLTAMSANGLANEHEDQLYLTGLAYKFSKTSLDDRALLKRNIEQRYALDYLRESYYYDISSDLVRAINQNYLVPMLKLYEHYRLSDDQTRQMWLEPYLRAISKGTDSESKVQKLLE